MEFQPKLKLTLSKNDKTIEIVGWADLIALWIITFLLTTKLTIFIFPIITSLIFLVLSILVRYPHVYNYPVPIKENNALRQYANATRLIRFLKISIACLSIIIVFGVTSTLKTGNVNFFGIILIPISLLIILGPLIIFISKSFKLK
jgi:hypothetical protein